MATITPDTSNIMFNLAVELVNQSSRNIFLTGRAGTGKTTFLKYIKENSPKQLAIVAPTGVAAINAGGVTIHSLFQLPVSPFIPEAKGFTKSDETVNKHSLISRLKMNNEKKKVLQELELLIIDEISMVRCDTLDAVDTILRHVRNHSSEPFGGVQVLFIGDMFQLPPVIKEQEWSFLSEYYQSPYFFDSLVMKEEKPVYIEFNKIYRQNEEQFIHLLNQVRNNELDNEGMEMLESRFQPAFRRTKDDGYIILTTHNETARLINIEKLQELDGSIRSFKADIEEEFFPSSYPADEILQVKEGAQVMFIKNDSDKSKRYFNGKIGVIIRIEEDSIFVKCKDEPDEIEIKRHIWENIRYSLNKTTRQLEESLLGSFSQFPLRLAWAITIHKSQGLTFEKAIIDAGKSFAAGQVYVALSRCTSFERMVLQSRINNSSLRTDQRIVNFSKSLASEEILKVELEVSRNNYRQKLLLSLFDLTGLKAIAGELHQYIKEHESSFNKQIEPWIQVQLDQLNKQEETANRFRQQLKQIFVNNDPAFLKERVKAASVHFVGEINNLILVLQQTPVITDSRIHAKEFNEVLKEILIGLSMKKHLMEGGEEVIDIDAFHQRKRNFRAPTFNVNAYAASSNKPIADVPHPALHLQLRKLRDSICERKGIALYLVAGTQTLTEMVTYLPQSLGELEKISGFGPAKLSAYGQQFLDIIVAYSLAHNLSSRIEEKIPKRIRKEKKEVKTDTKEQTLHLYQQGKTPSEIAGERMLSLQTIEGHLAFYIERGDINIHELVSREKILLIEPVIKEYSGGPLASIKEKLGNKIGFGEIKLVLAWTAFQKNQSD
ncbi:MAG TPA: helix-turn-helix domain-containing protein [Chitinophagaceae bacterium]